jgi:hypothetical protein
MIDILLTHWLNIIFVFLGMFMNTGMDSLDHNFNTSFARNWSKQFWNPSLSWKNKYSSKLPDALTDGWHLLKMLMLGFMMIAMSVNITGSFLTDLFLFIVYAVAWNLPFNFVYAKLRGK